MPIDFGLVRAFMEQGIPFNRFLGMKVVLLEPGRAILELPFRPEFIGDPIRPALHGGVLSTLIDTCGGAAVWTELGTEDRVSTIDLRVDYLRPGRSEALRVEGRVVRSGNRVAVVDLGAYHPGAPDQVVATGKGVYNVRRRRDPPEGPAAAP